MGTPWLTQYQGLTSKSCFQNCHSATVDLQLDPVSAGMGIWDVLQATQTFMYFPNEVSVHCRGVGLDDH